MLHESATVETNSFDFVKIFKFLLWQIRREELRLVIQPHICPTELLSSFIFVILSTPLVCWTLYFAWRTVLIIQYWFASVEQHRGISIVQTWSIILDGWVTPPALWVLQIRILSLVVSSQWLHSTNSLQSTLSEQYWSQINRSLLHLCEGYVVAVRWGLSVLNVASILHSSAPPWLSLLQLNLFVLVVFNLKFLGSIIPCHSVAYIIWPPV